MRSVTCLCLLAALLFSHVSDSAAMRPEKSVKALAETPTEEHPPHPCDGETGFERVDPCTCAASADLDWVDCMADRMADVGVSSACIDDMKAQNTCLRDSSCHCAIQNLTGIVDDHAPCGFDDACIQCLNRENPCSGTAKEEGRTCCKARTAQCLACDAGMSDAEFCVENPVMKGCPKAPIGEEGPWCCEALNAECMACQEGMSEETFCARRAEVDGCPEAHRCIDVQGWKDKVGDDCAWYGNGERCQSHGHRFANDGHTASTACCGCGGGRDKGADKGMDKGAASAMRGGLAAFMYILLLACGSSSARAGP